MSEPLTAEYRLELTYTVPNQIHKIRHYCEASPSVLAASGYFLFDRGGIADIDAGAAAQKWWTALLPLFHTSVLAPSWILHHRVGLAWNPVTAGVVTGAGSSGTTPNYASQFTISLNTDDFKRIREIILEQSRFVAAFKYVGYANLHSNAPAIADWLTGADADGEDGHQWVRSKNKKMLHATAPIVSSVYDLNDKVRRSRSVQ